MPVNYELIKTFSGKHVILLTSTKLKYETYSLSVYEDCVSFTDIKGNAIILNLTEIVQISEVRA